MRTTFTLLLLALCPLFVLSENYPYRSDVLWVTVPDHADWLYETGEEATIEVQLYRYGIPQDGLTLAYEIGPDELPADTSGELTLVAGRATLNIGTMQRPGFRDLRLTATIAGRTFKHHIKVGFSADRIEPYTQMPDDFDAFWQSGLDELSRVPLKYTLEPAPEYCTDRVDAQLLKLQVSRSGQCIYGYLLRPRDAEPGTCPVVLCPPGAGVKTIKEPLRHKYYSENGFVRLEFEIHGLDPRFTAEQFAEISKALNDGPNGYLNNGLDNRDNYYMRHVYLACVRCIDFLTSLPEWDGRNVAVQGGSQGGALSIVTAGLDPRITLCCANHPALADMAGYREEGRAGGYPHFFRTPGMDTPEKLQTMAYYDVVNFARRVTCPTRITWGYNDDTCPPTTSYATYNVMTCTKSAVVTPINEHWTSENMEYDHMVWIRDNLKPKNK